MTPAQNRLAERLGHSFAETGLFLQALTHRSIGTVNNERLEYLGDSILTFLVAEHLFSAYPDASEGKLTRLRARVVRQDSLAAAARRLGIGDALELSESELKTRGRERNSILADAFEAVAGALYLDAGVATCRRHLLTILADQFQAAALEDGRKDAKTRLQELLQSQNRPLPVYEIANLEGAPHCRVFTVRCCVGGMVADATGTGLSRKLASQDAAARILTAIDALAR